MSAPGGLDDLLTGVSGVLFDLDGVLLDSSAAVHRHWEAFAAWQGLDRAALLADVHGRRAADVIAQALPLLTTSGADALRWHEQLEVADLEGVVALPGARQTLRMLAPRRWAVVTSGTRLVAAARMRAAGLPQAPALVAADDLADGKPAPDPYLAGARLLGLPPHRCLAVEDSPAGLTSARLAGCRLLAVATTTPREELTAPVVLPDLRPVAAAVTRLRLRRLAITT